ncbi:ABC transporter permease [Thioalkalivibrio paradoxus]|uniref:ABC transporter permease n=1 Tax=Thioalkalivibrio paradoxus ARh 1 TaxID=713585 RepID=W0DFF0_9GAMM|nr:ABC transporter permease [Thioalkalivibrio paradoxus]AHE97091.1 ABC transporter permease [Thioalkalivibrio paradoxus ARh 1]
MLTWRGHLLAYFLAALAMVYLSYRLPGWLPGDFVTAMYADSHVALGQEQEAALRERLQQAGAGFGAYLLALGRLDWGMSYALRTPVSDLILEALPWTLLLMGSAHLLATVLGFIAGVEAAWRRGGRIERAGVGGMTVLQGVPEIGTGVLLLMVFAYHLGWLPAGSGATLYVEYGFAERVLDVLRHLALPLATLLLAWFPGNFLLARASMVLVLGQSFLDTARAKGLPPMRVRYAHAARNVLLPMATRFGLRFAFMVTGALVVETIFSYPGLGTLLFNAIGARDLPLIQGIVLFSALAVLGVNLVLEWVYGRLDPRVRVHGRAL